MGNSAITINRSMTPSSTDTLTNKDFDANGTGNSLSNVDVADLANGTDGELLTWAADGTADTVAVGTATHVLTSNGVGVAPTFQAAAGGGSDTAIDPLGSSDWFNAYYDFYQDGTNEMYTNNMTASNFVGMTRHAALGTEGFAGFYVPHVVNSTENITSFNTVKRLAIRILSHQNNGTGIFCPLGMGLSGGIVKTESSTENRICFLWEGSVLYAITGDGTTRTRTTISTPPTRTNAQLYSIDADMDSSSIKFYVNGTLKATHTTNIPSNTSALTFGVGLNTSADQVDHSGIQVAHKIQ